MAKIERSLGGAGTGKTRQILDKMSEAKRELRLSVDQIGFCTFTRAGRAEISDRAAAEWGVDAETLNKAWFRTAHSIAHKCLGVEEGRLINGNEGDEWLSDALGGSLAVKLDSRGERTYVSGNGGEPISQALQAWDLARARMCSVGEVLRRWEASGNPALDQSDVEATVKKYEQAKKRDDRLDFTDMIGRYAGVKFTADGPQDCTPEGDVPEDLRVLAIDEAQDSSQLVDRVCRRLAASDTVERIWISGDPYQCQPAGTPVLTLSGYKNIEDLDPAADRLVSFIRREGRFSCSGSEFEIASREVDSSSLIEITLADGTKHVSTDNHKWVVRTRGRKGTYATYIMAKGGRWRIGTVQVFAGKPSKKNGSFRLKMRMNQEAADSVWILKVFDTDRDARCYEQIVSCRYGIPQVTFRPPMGVRTNLDEGYIEEVFNSLGDLTKNGEDCLYDHGLSPDHPMCRKADRCKNGPMASRLIHAANLLPGIHLVPKMDENKKCEWVGIVSCRRLPSGSPTRVWSMNVRKHHTYVTRGGVVTGNSIHSFAGGDYRLFLGWDAVESIMPRSYRCPDSILKLGERCLRQMKSGYRDRGIAPAEHDGVIRTSPDAADAISLALDDPSVLILGRCKYSLDLYEDYLVSKGIPYSWVDKTHGTKSLSGYAALWSLEHGEPCKGEDWGNAVSMLSVKDTELGELLFRGEKAAWSAGKRNHVDVVIPEDWYYDMAGAAPALRNLIKTGRWVNAIEPKSRDKAARWYKSAKEHGVECACNPRIRLSTIHSAKGLEADTVILSSIVSNAVERGRNALEDLHDEECRVAYVAVTRARRKFVYVSDATYARMEIPL